MEIHRERVGELSIILEALLWGLFPVITILSFASLSPLVSLGWSTLFATFFFGLLLTIRRSWSDVWNVHALKDVLLSAGIIGILYYLLFFTGLKYTSAGNASLIALSEVFFSFCFFNLFRKEYISGMHLIGAVLMLVGAGIVLYPHWNSFHGGDLLILGACIVAPIGNLFQRRARAKVSSESILFVRSLLTAPVVFLLAFIFNSEPFALPFGVGIFALLLINGFFLFGLSKILWVEGIYRINVAKANALGSLSPLVTLLAAYVLLHTPPTVWQLSAFVPMFFGVLFLSSQNKKTPAPYGAGVLK